MIYLRYFPNDQFYWRYLPYDPFYWYYLPHFIYPSYRGYTENWGINIHGLKMNDLKSEQIATYNQKVIDYPRQVNLTMTSPSFVIGDNPAAYQSAVMRTFKPGSTIPISGKVTGAVQTNQQITVSLYWGDRPQSDRLISKQSFALSADGSFQRNFQVPNTSFPGATGGQFVMTFEFPNAQTQTIPMSILTVKPGQTQ